MTRAYINGFRHGVMDVCQVQNTKQQPHKAFSKKRLLAGSVGLTIIVTRWPCQSFFGLLTREESCQISLDTIALLHELKSKLLVSPSNNL